MLLNSFEFILVFLPTSLVAYHAARPFGRTAQCLIIVALSLTFYWMWAGVETIWLLLSILGNLVFLNLIGRFSAAALPLLVVALVLNISYLAYFKYAAFFAEQIGLRTSVFASALPLGISFFTFTQVMFLIDLYRRQASVENPVTYGAFVSFYPHLPAGPLYHYSEIVPQLREPPTRDVWEDLSVGWTIFVIGLAKKTFADRYVPMVDAAFSASANAPTIYAAWMGTLGYTLQIYFDFSAYSDMAIGIARMFGIVFPENFRSPYKAASIIEFWRCWHMTLSRFLRDYLYIPLGGNRNGPARHYLNILITVTLGGLWHGANWTYIAWGALHGLFLVVNHLWRNLSPSVRIPTALSIALTFLCVTVAWVLFRATDFAQAAAILQTMVGAGAKPAWASDVRALDLLLVLLGLVFVWSAPNTQEIMQRYQPVLGKQTWRPTPLTWAPTPRYALATALVFALCLTQVSAAKVFLYWNF
jgi:alginate O-acetyltransferase complex protein AlgI